MSVDLDKSTWKRVAFGDVVKNLNSTVKDPAAASIDRVIAMEHLDPRELKISRWGSIEDGTTFTRQVQPGQTLFGKRRAYQRKAAYTEFDAICSGDILVFQADPEHLLPEFLPFIVQSERFYDHAIGTSAGSLSPRTNWGDLSGFEFDLPPLDVQQRIAELLWALERHRMVLARALRECAEVEAAWLDSIYVEPGVAHQSVGALSAAQRVSFMTGPFGSTLAASEYVEGGVPVIHPSFIREGGLTVDQGSTVTTATAARLARWAVREGDLIFMRKRDVTRTAIVQTREAGWILGSDCIALRISDTAQLDPRFVQAMLRSPTAKAELLKRAPGTAMPGINEGSLKALKLPALGRSDQLVVVGSYRKMVDARHAIGGEAALALRLRATMLRDIFGDIE